MTTDYVIVIIVFLCFYSLLVPMFNCFLSILYINIKWFKPLRFNDRESPIYKLSYSTYSGYRVEKHYLGWDWMDFASGSNPLKRSWIPFAGIFKYYRYHKDDNEFGSFEDYELEGLDIETYWEEEYAKFIRIQEAENSLKQNVNNSIDKINHKFNKNYIK